MREEKHISVTVLTICHLLSITYVTAAGLRASNTQSTFVSELVRPWYAAGHHGTWSIIVMNTISLLLLGGHALTSLEGGGPCLLGTFDYGVVGHLAFRLT